ncbi:hypothetical protein N7G274_001196 [Stereocaulon virgatum]|uniref:Uncharacterized protein n=1 Tax=Stereocaulon virgatum TaxID=373712 RepID=A0ABR4AQW1_9LECA
MTAKQTKVPWKQAKDVPIAALVWGPAQTLLISAETTSRILACKIDYKAQHWEVTGPVLDTHLEHSVNQLTLGSQEDVILTSSSMPGSRRLPSPVHMTARAKRISLLNSETFAIASLSTDSTRADREPYSDSESLPSSVQQIIGQMGSNLIFLDESLWVCSMVINGYRQGYSRHFLVPDDWLYASQTLLLKVTPQGDC